MTSPLPRLLALKQQKRCGWANEKNALYLSYHDQEWGQPVHDDRQFFESLILDGAQAGLSWETILNKRENYRQAFDRFDWQIIASYKEPKIRQLLRNPGIVRNRLKIHSTIKNAQAYITLREEFGSFDGYVWRFVGGKTIQNSWRSLKEVPACSAESDALSKDLKQRGFNFVGSTICYALMQAVGLVNDHLVDCFRYKGLSR